MTKIIEIDGVPIIDSEDFSEEGESSQKNYRSEIQVNECCQKIGELLREKEWEIEQLRKKLSGAKTERDRLRDAAINFISQQREWQAKKTEVLERRKKEVGDEYDVYNLEKINANYEKQLSEAKKQEEQMEAKEEVIRDYTRVIKHKELEKEILEVKWEILDSERRTLHIEKSLLENKVEAQKDNLKEKELKKQISEKDFEISRWEKAAESLDADLKKAKEEKETLRLKFVRVCRELDEYKNVISPEWLRKLTHRVDWFLDTDLERSSIKLWVKRETLGRLLLLSLIFSVLLYLFSWVIRILKTIGRNVAAIFRKKQNTAQSPQRISFGRERSQR